MKLTVHNRRLVSPGSSVCYGELGCFSNDAPFFSLQRPISLLPQSPDTINPKFTLYTRQSPTQGRQLKAGDKVGLLASTFSATRPSKFIVHGWLDNGILGTWMVVRIKVQLPQPNSSSDDEKPSNERDVVVR